MDGELDRAIKGRYIGEFDMVAKGGRLCFMRVIRLARFQQMKICAT
jgi:hypothetical protein